MRPKQSRFTDHRDPDSYYNLNRYYNEAEKMFDKLEAMIPKLQKDARPYTGEYAGGQLDLVCDILGIERIDWSDYTR